MSCELGKGKRGCWAQKSKQLNAEVGKELSLLVGSQGSKPELKPAGRKAAGETEPTQPLARQDLSLDCLFPVLRVIQIALEE